MSKRAWFKSLVVSLGLVAAQAAVAGPKTLIELDGDTPKAGLATSWTKVKDGEYSFQLDPAGEVAKGVAVTPAAVKSSLEAKLSALGVKVTAKGANGVSIVYTGPEKAFLAKLANTKVRGGDVALALESSTSEGSIRAKKIERPAGPGEVKATVLKTEPGVIIAMTSDSQAPLVKGGEKVQIKADSKGLKKNDSIFFKPTAKTGAEVTIAPGSLVH